MSTDALAPPSGPLYDSIYFGIVMSTVCYGVACMQTFYYYVHYKNDRLHTKLFVVTLWLFNTIHEALCITGAYKYITAGLANPSSFTTVNPELILMSLFTALIAAPTQGFLVYRIYIFSEKNIILPLMWAVLAPVEIVTRIIYIVKALYTANGAVQVVDLDTLNSGPFVLQASLALSVSAAIDVLIAISMTYLLVRRRATVKFASTAHILQRLIVFSVNTGTWTAMFAVVTVIMLHVFPTNWISTVSMIPLCAGYYNTLLANLNARAYVFGSETTCIVDSDMFLDPSWLSSDKPKGDKRHRESMMVFASNPELWPKETTEATAFLGTHPSTPEARV